jgi:hypothetical protein
MSWHPRLQFEDDDTVGPLSTIGESHSETFVAHDRTHKMSAELRRETRSRNADVLRIGWKSLLNSTLHALKMAKAKLVALGDVQR